MAHFRHTPHISEIEAQIKWEMAGVERGVLRAREMILSQNLGDGEIGTKVMRRCLPPLIDLIRKAQAEASAGIDEARRGGQVQWWWLILCLPPETLAVLTLKPLLSFKPREFTFNLAVTSAATSINTAIWLQLDFERWKEAEGQKEDADNQYLRYLRSTKEVDERSFKRFSEKIGRVRLERWDQKTGIAFGVKLIQLLVEAAPNWFSIETARLRGGRTEYQIVLSPEARDTIADFAEQTELNRPMLLPTICPPAGWRAAARTRPRGPSSPS